jgi:tetratricopeptide (TPR) repeat protein
MRSTASRWWPFLVVAVFLPPSPARAAEARLTQKQVYRQTLRGTVKVYVRFGNITVTGTGWVADQKLRLVMTNHHVVGNASAVSVLFPLYNAKGKAVSDPRRYDLKKAIQGKVLDSDPKRDLAVIQVATLPTEASALKLAAESPDPADTLHSVGNPGVSAAMWVYTKGAVRQVVDRQINYAKIGQLVDCTIVETTSPINPGDSGGPVVNNAGELVAVNTGAGQGRLMSFCIDVTVVRGFLGEVKALLDPKTATAAAFLSRGVRSFNRRLYDRAIADFTEAIKRNAKLAPAYLARARSFLHKADYATALTDYNRTLALDPNNASAYNERGRAYIGLKNYDRAIADFTEAIRLAPRTESFYTNRAGAFLAKKDYRQAIASYDESIRLTPNSFLLYTLRALCHQSLASYDRAAGDYGVAIRLNPKFSPPYLARGQCYYQLNNNYLALNDFLTFLRLKGPHSDTYGWVGDVQSRLKNFDQAVLYYSLALTYNHPRKGEVYRRRAFAYYATAKYDLVIQDCSSALGYNYRDAFAYLLRGWAYESRNELPRAQGDYAQAVRLDPSLDKLAPAQNRCLFRLVNNTGKNLKVYLRYRGLTRNGIWKWFPGGRKKSWLFYRVAKGQSILIANRKGMAIKAERVRIRAKAGKKRRWKGLRLLTQGSYRARAMMTYALTLNP